MFSFLFSVCLDDLSTLQRGMQDCFFKCLHLLPNINKILELYVSEVLILYLQDSHKISSLGLIGEVFEITLNSIVNITTKIHHKNGGAGSA